jgi:hypothetical protein
MSNIIFVAISKKTGGVMSGAKGQYAFDDKSTLKRSVNYSYQWEANREGKHPSELYDIHEIDVAKAIAPQENKEPFTVHEVHGANWNDESWIEINVDGREAVSIGSLSECPEDASLERDLNFVYDIADLLEKAHKAGAEGRPFVYTDEDEEEE